MRKKLNPGTLRINKCRKSDYGLRVILKGCYFYDEPADKWHSTGVWVKKLSLLTTETDGGEDECSRWRRRRWT